MLVTTEASVNVPADHDPRSHSLDRVEQFAATDVLHAARVQVEGAVAMVDRGLMRYQDVDAVGYRRVDPFQFGGPLHERPPEELVGPRRCPHGDMSIRAA